MYVLVMPAAGMGLFILQLVIVFGLLRLSGLSESVRMRATCRMNLGLLLTSKLGERLHF